MKIVFLNMLESLETLRRFDSVKADVIALLGSMPDYLGVAFRFYIGYQDMWDTQHFGLAEGLDFEEICDFSEAFADENSDEELFCRKHLRNRNCRVVITSYYKNRSHLADAAFLLSDNLQEPLHEWGVFADYMIRLIAVKYKFPDFVNDYNYENSQKLLSFVHETQSILDTNRFLGSALYYELARNKTSSDFSEDSGVLEEFLRCLHRDFNLYACFILQYVSPTKMHEILLVSEDNEENVEASVFEIMNITRSYSHIDRRTEIHQHTILAGKSPYAFVKPLPMIFACQAGGETYGHIGICVCRNQIHKHLGHDAKLMPMLANQLGLYFSHFYRIRREARRAGMLKRINQTCNAINSAIDSTAILFKLVESLNYLFGQYSGAVVMFSHTAEAKLEVSNYLGGAIPAGFDMEALLNGDNPITEAIREGYAFDNSSGDYPLPVRYAFPLATTPQNLLFATDFLTAGALGGVILFDSDLNKKLSDDELKNMLPILLNGVSSSLQVAANYAEKLDTIKSLEGLIAMMSDVDSFFDEMLNVIKRLLKVNRISYLEMDESGQYLILKKSYGLPAEVKEGTKIPLGEEISGYVASKGQSYRIDNIEAEGIFQKRSEETYLNRSLLSVPLLSGKGDAKRVRGVINVNNKLNGLTFTSQDQQLLEAVAHLVVTALENLEHMKRQHDNILLERQLQDARDIQMSLLPKNFNSLPKPLEVYGKSEPAKQIGGDFFDILTLKDGRIMFIMGDVSGKGMPAAILMSLVRMILRPLALNYTSLDKLLFEANKLLAEELDSYHFVTLQMVAVNWKTGECEMVSAGHGPLMVHLSGKQTLIEAESGIPLGLFGEESKYSASFFTMNPGDSFIMYTDGLSEEKSYKGEMFGTERISKLYQRHSHEAAQSLVKTLISATVNWRMGEEAHDDLTVMAIKYKGIVNSDGHSIS